MHGRADEPGRGEEPNPERDEQDLPHLAEGGVGTVRDRVEQPHDGTALIRSRSRLRGRAGGQGRFLAGDRALAVAAMSYDGGVAFGLIGDYDALPDLDVIATGIRSSLDDLLALAAGNG